MEKLKWKAKFDTNFSDELDFLETILKSYGIEDIKGFLHPVRNKVLNDPFLFENMEAAVKLFHDNLDKKIIIKVDSDCDGATSSTLTTAIIKHFNPNADIKYLYSFEKEHGLTYKNISKFSRSDVGFIIIPDASMECRDAIQITRNYDAPILVLDHHLMEDEFLDTQTNKWVTREEARVIWKSDTSPDKSRIKVDKYTNYCLAVNDTDGKYPNPTLSGVGVVMKFAEAYCKYYGYDDEWLEKYYDLVSLGLVCDSVDCRNTETRWYILQGLKPEFHHNEFFNELHERLKNDMHEERTITNIGWTIGPRINAIYRYGKEEEQINLIRAMIGEQEDIEYQPRRKSKNDPKPPVEIHTLQWDMARVADNAKSRQDSDVRSFMQKVEKKIEDEHLLNNSVLFIDCDNIVDKKTVTGLISNKLASKYFRPVVMMKSRNAQNFGGSGRNYAQGPIENLNQFLTDVGVTCSGHSSAFGINIKKDELDDIIKKCNDLLPIETLSPVYSVDWEIPADKLKQNHVKEVADSYAVWGNTVPTPTFAITNIRINASKINAYGENKNFIKFNYNGVTYIKKYCPQNDYDNMTLRDRKVFGVNKKNLVINIIAQFQNEIYEDKVYPEVKILQYDVVEDANASDIVDDILGEIAKNTSSKSDADSWDFIEKKEPKKAAAVLLDDDDFDW